MSPYLLLLIIPISTIFGFFICAILVAGKNADNEYESMYQSNRVKGLEDRIIELEADNACLGRDNEMHLITISQLESVIEELKEKNNGVVVDKLKLAEKMNLLNNSLSAFQKSLIKMYKEKE